MKLQARAVEVRYLEALRLPYVCSLELFHNAQPLDSIPLTDQDICIQALEEQTELDTDDQLIEGSQIESHCIKLSQTITPSVRGPVPLHSSTQLAKITLL